MSRYSVSLPDEKSLNFGFDHTLGYFYDIIDENEEEMIEEASSRFEKLTGFALAQKIEELMGSVHANSRFGKLLDRMKMDLDF